MTENRLALASPLELPSPDTVAKVMLGGDLRDLTAPQKVSYYRAVCDSIGLNPLTKPFEFITLSGRLVLYATRNATDQLRKIYGISVHITAREVLEDTYVVTARATMPTGRYDESTGAVPIAQLKGDGRANAMLKCETKAKRRVTLSLVGLSTLDESEVESIPNAAPVSFNPEDGAISSPALPRASGAADGRASAAIPPQAAPADLNPAPIPEAWVPFVKSEPLTAITGTIVTGRRSQRTGKVTIVLDTGQEFHTLSLALGSQAMQHKEANEAVTLTATEDGELVSLQIAHDAAF